MLIRLFAIVPILLCFGFAQADAQQADEFKLEPDFEMLFDGKDLTGWNFLPTTERQKRQRANWQKNNPKAPPWPIYEKAIDFDGKTKSDDGRFVADDGKLVVTVPPGGRKIQMLYTKREFKGDFTLKLEFRAATGADSGVFIKGKQLQCRDYPNAGPYKELTKFKPNDWNELIVVVKGETAHCTCNGEVLEAKFQVPEAGPIGVEGDQGKMEYRRIRINTGDGGLKATNKKDSWTFELTEDGKGTIKEDGEAITFETTVPGSENWHVQAYQAGLVFEEGAEYTLSFEIKSPTSSTVLVQTMINQDDWHQIGLHEEIYAGKEFSKQEFTFTATDVADGPHNRIGFVLGEDEGVVSVKNMTLAKKK